jgi:hypothetical protein
MKPEWEFRKDGDGNVDEIIAEDVQIVHLERMDNGHWWLGITLQDGSRITSSLISDLNTRIHCLAHKEEP